MACIHYTELQRIERGDEVQKTLRIITQLDKILDLSC